MKTHRFHKILNAQIIRARISDSIVIGAAERVSFTNAIVQRAKILTSYVEDCTLSNSFFSNGTASNPSISFVNDSDTGIFFNPLFPNSLSFSTQGNESFRFSLTSLLAPNGTVSNPSYSFSSSPSNGIYAPSSNEVAFAMGGTRVMGIFSNRIEIAVAMRVANGSAATPSYSFSNQTNAGMFLSGTNTIGFSTVGVSRGFLSSTNWGLSTNLTPTANGTIDVGSDSLAFGRIYTTALNCGAFRPLNDTVDRLTLTTSQLTCNVTVRPAVTNTHNLGASTNRWLNCFLNNAPDVSSDIRLKKNVEDLGFGLETIDAMRPKQFEYIDDPDEKTRFGFIAQDLLTIFQNVDRPSFITGNGTDEYYGLDVTSVIPILVKAIQELNAEVEFLRNKLNL